MKKDVNKWLLFLILIPIALFIIFSAYYLGSLREINKQNELYLEEVTGKVSVELNKTNNVNSLLLQDKQVLESGYSEIKRENDELKATLNKMQAEMDSLKTELGISKSNFDILQTRFLQVQDSLVKANEQISSLNYKVKQLCDRLKEKGEEC